MADADDGMDRATIERNLAQVERDMRAASEDIAHQRQTLRDLVRHGEDTTEAVRSIGILEHTHLVLRSLRDQLADELAALDQARGVRTPAGRDRWGAKQVFWLLAAQILLRFPCGFPLFRKGRLPRFASAAQLNA